jgi:hypothetical protein
MIWLLLLFTTAFAALAYDAYRMSTLTKEVPFQEIAKSLGLENQYTPFLEQERWKLWNKLYGLGDPNQAFWGWVALSICCALLALATFMELI